ncbi:MAG: PKD-like domain-containing protein [Bacteroidota bacterium]|nr:PKD-like domain-containing protein [Bacteroidota bacterium]
MNRILKIAAILGLIYLSIPYSYSQCPTITGKNYRSVPSSCIGSSDAALVVTITSTTFSAQYRLYSGTSPLAGATYNPAGFVGPGTFVITVSNIVGGGSTYDMRYGRPGCNISNPPNPNPILSTLSVAGLALPNSGFASNVCLSSPFVLLSGSDPSTPNGAAYYAHWNLAGPGVADFTDITDPSAIIYNFTSPGFYSATWNNSISGCSGTVSAPSSADFDVVQDPPITSMLTSTVCSGSTFNYTVTSTIIGSSFLTTPTYTWSRSVVPGISNTANSGTNEFISESLINTTNAPVNVFYQLQATTPDIGSGVQCTGNMSVLTVTVYPQPNVSISGVQTICGNQSITLSLSSNIPASRFTWTSSVIAGAVIGNTNNSVIGLGPIVNTLSGGGTVQYIVQVIVPGTGCIGNSSTANVIVNPLPTITGLSASPVCSGLNTNVLATINPAFANNISWSLALPGGLSGPASGVGMPINISIVNSTANTLTGIFTLIPNFTGSACVGPSTTVSQIVYPNPIVTSTAPGTICSGSSFIRTLTSNIAVSGFTIIRLANPNVLETSTTNTFAGTTINHTLTGTTGNVETVQYIIIPISSSNCTGSGVTINVTINPLPTVVGVIPPAQCAQTNFTINLSSNPLGATFGWIRAVQTGVSGNNSGNGNIIDNITLLTSTSLNVLYSVTPTITGCVGPTTTITQLINPRPTISGTSFPVCNGNAASVSITSTPAGVNLNWATTSLSSGLSGSVGSGVGIPNPILTNIGNVTATGIFSITPTGIASSCIGQPITLNQQVYPTPIITSSGTGNICSGTQFNYTILSNLSGTTYNWSRPLVAGIQEAATVSSGNLIKEVLTNNTTSAVNAIYNITINSPVTCPGTVFTLTVTVAPAPTITGYNAFPLSICSGLTTNIIPVSNQAGTVYTFNGVGAGASNQLTTVAGIFQTLSSSLPTLANYSITPIFNGCLGVSTLVSQFVNPNPTLTGIGNTTICSGLSVTYTASGANTYNWQPGNLSGPIQTLSPSSTTTYTISASNTSGCTTTGTTTVTVNPLPIVTVNSGIICVGQNASLTATGAVNYTWQPGNLSGTVQNLSPASTTNYTIIGTNGNGCTSTGFATISVNSSPIISVSNATICVGQSASLSASGANTYNWQPGNLSGAVQNLSPLLTTIYTVTGTSLAGCTATGIGTVTVNTLPSINANNATICSGQFANISVSGAITYNWQPGNLSGAFQSLSPVSSTIYTIIGTNGSGCTATGFASVTVNSLPVISVNNSNICIGQSVSLTATGAVSYNWQPGNLSGNIQTLNPAITTTYTITGSNAFGCTSTGLATITVNPLPNVSVNSASVCAGTAAMLTATGAVNYNWQPGNLTGPVVSLSPSSTTNYTITGTSGPGCTALGFATISVTSLPNISIAGTSSICQGSSLVLTLSGATSYSSNIGVVVGNLLSDTPLFSGNLVYSVTGTFSGCSNTNTFNLNVLTVPSSPTVTTPISICQYTPSSMLTASGIYSLRWYTTSSGGVFSGTAPTPPTSVVGAQNYYVSQFDGTCESPRSNINVIIQNIPAQLSVPQTIYNFCQNGSSSVLQHSVGSNVNWFTTSVLGAGVPNPVPFSPPTNVLGSFVNWVSQNNGTCESIRTPVTVSVNMVPTLTGSNSASYCAGSSATLTVSGAVSYSWSPATGLNTTVGASVITNSLSSTTYVVTGTVAGCSSTFSIPVNVTASPNLIGANPAPFCVNTGQALNIAGATTYIWSPSNVLNTTSGNSVIATFTVAGVQNVSVIGFNGVCQSPVFEFVLTVNPNVNVPNVPSGSNSICKGTLSTNYSTSSTPASINATSIVWSMSSAGTSSINSASGVVNWDVNYQGLAQISVTGIGCGSNQSSVLVVTINGIPSVTGTLVNGLSSCLVNDALITLSGIGGQSPYTYTLGGVFTNGTGVFSSLGSGLYSTSIFDANGCSNSGNSVNVLSVGTTTSPIINGGGTFCLSQGDIVTDLTVSGTGSTLTLYANVALTSVITSTSGANIIFTPTITGTYYATQTSGGCESNSVNVSYTINNTPIPTVSGNLNYCLNDNSPHTISATGGNLVWYDATQTIVLGSGNSFAPQTADLLALGTVNYYVRDEIGACFSQFSMITITVNSSTFAGCSCTNFMYYVPSSFVNTDTKICHKEVKTVDVFITNGNAPYFITYTENRFNSTVIVTVPSTVSTNPYKLSITGYNIGSPTTTYVTYTIQSVVDVNSCNASIDITDANNMFTFTHYSAPTITGIIAPNPVCAPFLSSITSSFMFTPGPPVDGWFAYYNNQADLLNNVNSFDGLNIASSGTYYARFLANMAGDGVLCHADSNVSLVVNSQPTALISGTTSICGGNTATLFYNLTGTPNWTLQYFDGFSNQVLSGLSASNGFLNFAPAISTTYSITGVSDGNGCSNNASSTATIFVLSPANPLCNCNAFASIQPPGVGQFCEGTTATFPIPISVSGVANASVVILENGINPTTVNGLSAGLNSVSLTVNATTNFTIQQVIGATCSGLGSGLYTVTQTPLPNLSVSSPLIVNCSQSSVDLSTAFVDLKSTTGVVNYWRDAAATIPLANPSVVTAPGTYYIQKVTGTSPTTCSGIVPVLVQFGSVPSAIISGNNAICAGNGSNFSLFLTGTPPFNVVYTDGTSNFTISGLNSSTTVGVNPLTTVGYSLISVSDANCSGTVSGAANISILPAISCSGCAVSATPLALAATNVSCNGLDANWQTVSGVGISYILDYTSIAGFATFNSTTLVGNTFNINGLSSSTVLFYRLSSINACGASGFSNIITTTILSVPAAPANVTITSINCNGFTATWDAIAGSTYEYDLSNDALFATTVLGQWAVSSVSNSAVFNGLPNGDYFIRVRAINTCGMSSNSTTATTTLNNSVSASITSVAFLCTGGSASLTVTFTGTPPFNFNYRDALGNDLTKLNYNSNIFNWNVGSAGTYTILDVSNAGCTTTLNGVIGVVTTTSVTASVSILSSGFQASCKAKDFTFTANGQNLGSAPTYMWYLNNQIVSSINGPVFVVDSAWNLPSGNTIQVLASIGGVVPACLINPTTTLTSSIQNFGLTSKIIDTLTTSKVTCIGGMDGAAILYINPAYYNSNQLLRYSFVAGGPYSFPLTTTSNILAQIKKNKVTSIKDSTYRIYVIDSTTSCSQTVDIPRSGTILFQPSPASLSASCIGNDGSILFQMDTLNVKPPYAITITGIDNNGIITTPQIQTGITNPSVSFAGFTGGKYVAYINYGSCSIQYPRTITVDGTIPPIADLGNDTTICFGASILLSTPGIGTGFQWYRNDTLLPVVQTSRVNFLPTKATKYTVRVLGLGGCFAEDNILVDVAKLRMKLVSTQFSETNNIEVKWTIRNKTKFPGDTLQIQRLNNATAGSLWENAGTVNKLDTTFIHKGVNTSENSWLYRVASKANPQCVTDSVHNTIVLKATGSEQTNKVNLVWNEYTNWPFGVKEYQIWRSIDGSEWKQLINDPRVIVNFTNNTSAELSNVIEGFKHKYRILAIPNAPFSPTDTIESWSNISNELLFMREVTALNAFTPNNDGVVDKFTILNIEAYPDNELFIVNRWGATVYYAKPYSNANGWDGNGQADGTYFWVLRLGNGVEKKGNVLLQR